MMSANEQISFDPPLEDFKAEDRQISDSDLWFAQLHYQLVDRQPGAAIQVRRLDAGPFAPEEDESGKATQAFGRLILVDRTRDKETEIGESETRTFSCIHSLRQLHTKLKLIDAVSQKPSLLQTTIVKVGYEGDFDLLEELVGQCNLFQDAYPYCFVKTGPKLKPKVDYQLIFSRLPGDRSASDFCLAERGVLGLRDVTSTFSKVEVPGEGALEIEWPQPPTFSADKNMTEDKEDLIRVLLKVKPRAETEWIRDQDASEGLLKQNFDTNSELFSASIPPRTSLIVEVHYFLGKSQVTLKKADFSQGETPVWRKASLQAISRMDRKKLGDLKALSTKAIQALSEEFARTTKSQMFFYSYSNFVEDSKVRLVSFESLPDYSKIPQMPPMLEEYLNKKIKKK